MYNKEEEEVEERKKFFFTDRINITIILIFKIRKSLFTIDITDHKKKIKIKKKKKRIDRLSIKFYPILWNY